jgi:ubiquinone/menaquinone biosynthesis C-methylase UbiE
VNDDFYLAFEARFRGPRELILGRLRAYEPFLNPLAEVYSEGRAVDLGCGRGEWLELLRDMRFKAVGVDLNDAMLADCRSRQLQVVTADAIDYLRTLPDASHCLVSAFHLVEHIPFERLRELVTQAHRILQPGGLLILETPNVENVQVGTSLFYMDPSHLRPVPPLLLAFVAEFSGFKKTKVLGLNGEALPLPDQVAISNVLGGVSRDCSIVAQKTGVLETMGRFDAAFRQEWGVSLPQLAAAYEQAILSRIEGIQLETKPKIEEAKARIEETKAEIQEREAEIEAQFRARFTTDEEQAQRTHDELVDLRAEMDQMKNELSAANRALLAIQNREAARWSTVRRFHASVRSAAGRMLRRLIPLARSIAHKNRRIKKLVRAILMSSPALARFVSRFLDPGQAASLLAPVRIRLFQDLRSVKLMSAIAKSEQQGSSIIFIEKDEHGI